MKIIAKKLGMSQIWKNDAVTPVTILKVPKEIISEFKEGDRITATGISKGKGFQGVVKRHGFAGGPKSHGQKDRLRAPGSIGSTAPQRGIKGKKMAGRMGRTRITVKNLVVIELRPEEEKIFVKGAVPGIKNAPIEIKKI